MGPGIPPEMAKEHLGRGQELIFTLVGTSMWPVMGRGGAEVPVQPLDDSAWRVGARVLITVKDRLVLHRVVALEADRALVKGDNNRFTDGWYAREELLGALPVSASDRAIAWLSGVPGHPISTLWAIWRRLF